jgi:hypothetical protein
VQKLDIHDTAGLTRYVIGGGSIESSVQQDHRLTDWNSPNQG